MTLDRVYWGLALGGIFFVAYTLLATLIEPLIATLGLTAWLLALEVMVRLVERRLVERRPAKRCEPAWTSPGLADAWRCCACSVVHAIELGACACGHTCCATELLNDLRDAWRIAPEDTTDRQGRRLSVDDFVQAADHALKLNRIVEGLKLLHAALSGAHGIPREPTLTTIDALKRALCDRLHAREEAVSRLLWEIEQLQQVRAIVEQGRQRLFGGPHAD